MAFLEILREMLSRQQVSDLATNVALVSVERQEAGNPKKFLNLNYAKHGQVEWVDAMSAGLFGMKGKIMRDVLPKVKDAIGKYTFVSRDDIEQEFELGVRGRSAIPTDVDVKLIPGERY